MKLPARQRFWHSALHSRFEFKLREGNLRASVDCERYCRAAMPDLRRKTMAERAVNFTEEDKEILVKIVKLSQARQIKGSKGDWQEFLNSHDSKFGSLLCDPGKKSWDVLAAFVKTFTAKEDLKLVTRIMRWKKRKLRRSHMEESLDMSPEQALVHLTYKHPKSERLYSFPSYHEEWLVTKLRKLPNSSTSERLISIDCEMVRCEDGSEEVVKVCAVDQNLETLMDLLVKPSKPVINYLTEITGVTAEDLEDVTCSLKDVQKKLKKLLTPSTIVIGHSVHHDLRALKVDHARVIDTAFIFQYQKKPSCYTPSLSNLCKVVLGYELREEGKPHICLDDAIAAMKLTLAKLDRGLNDPLDMGDLEVNEADFSKLYIHKIPIGTSEDKLQNLFPKKYSVEIQAFSPVKNRYCTTFAVFKTVEDADEAFENLKGELEMDSYGRPQKCIAFRTVGSKKASNTDIVVRKMHLSKYEASDSQLDDCKSDSVLLTRKRPSEGIDNICNTDTEETLQNSKKIKHERSTNQESLCENNLTKEGNKCVHLKEQERLVKVLEQRDAEIRDLQRIIAALIRKNGL